MSKGDADVCVWGSPEHQPSPGSSSGVSRSPIKCTSESTGQTNRSNLVKWKAGGKIIYFFSLVLLFAGFPSGLRLLSALPRSEWRPAAHPGTVTNGSHLFACCGQGHPSEFIPLLSLALNQYKAGTVILLEWSDETRPNPALKGHSCNISTWESLQLVCWNMGTIWNFSDFETSEATLFKFSLKSFGFWTQRLFLHTASQEAAECWGLLLAVWIREMCRNFETFQLRNQTDLF